MSLLNYSLTLQGGANENINDVTTLFNEVRSTVNSLNNDNIAAGAGIAYSKLSIPDGSLTFAKLAALTSGNILVGSAGNVATSVNPSGAVDVSNTGAFTLFAHSLGQGSATSLPNTGAQTPIDNCAVTPAAGTWMFWGKVRIEAGGAGELLTATVNLLEGLTVRDVSHENYGGASGSQIECTPSIGPQVLVLDGTEAVTLTAGQVGTVGAGTTSHGRLAGIRLS